MSERFVDLKIQAECDLLLLDVTESFEERKGLLHDLRLAIAELDLEVGNTLSSHFGDNVIAQMEYLGLP